MYALTTRAPGDSRIPGSARAGKEQLWELDCPDLLQFESLKTTAAAAAAVAAVAAVVAVAMQGCDHLRPCARAQQSSAFALC